MEGKTMVKRNVEAVVLSKEYSDDNQKVNAMFSLALLDIARKNVRLRSWQVDEGDDLSALRTYVVHDLREKENYVNEKSMFVHMFYKVRDEIFEDSSMANLFEKIFVRLFEEDFAERENYQDLLGYFANAFDEKTFYEGVEQAEMVLRTIIKQVVEVN